MSGDLTLSWAGQVLAQEQGNTVKKKTNWKYFADFRLLFGLGETLFPQILFQMTQLISEPRESYIQPATYVLHLVLYISILY